MSLGPDEALRMMRAAQSGDWSLGVTGQGDVIATQSTAQVGFSWVVIARRVGPGWAVSFYAPGDDVSIEGEHVGELRGAARDCGRQLRSLLEELSDRVRLDPQ